MKQFIISDEDRNRSINAIAFAINDIEHSISKGEHNPFTLSVLKEEVNAMKICSERMSHAEVHDDSVPLPAKEPRFSRYDMKMLLQEVLDNMFVDVPQPHCNCHSAPPCSDCVDYGTARDLQKRIKEALA